MDVDLHVTSLAIPTRAGTLEGRLVRRDGADSRVGMLFLPPHPLFGGNLGNNVVRAVARCVARDGVPVILFNYRGVGESFRPRPDLPLFEYWSLLDREGSYTDIEMDVREVHGFGRGLFERLHLVAYSFGATFLGGLAAAGPPSWCAIAPSVSLPEALGAWPGLVIEPEDDGLLPVGPRTRPASARRVVAAGADHFFRGREEEVASLVSSWSLAPAMESRP